MSDLDALTLLAAANPVRAEELKGLDASTLNSILARSRSGHGRLWVAAAAVAIATGGAVAVAVFGFGGSPKRVQVEKRMLQAPPTLAHPLPRATQVSLADATTTLGAPIVLPDTSFVPRSEAGPVWLQDELPHYASVAVTFPDARVIVYYLRPVQYPEPAPAMYRAEARQQPDTMRVIDLRGVPALATRQNSDQLKTNFGSIEFVVGGTEISVLGHYDEATLRAVAQSIVDRTPNPESPMPPIEAGPALPEIHVGSVAAADTQLPFEVVLPSARPLVMEVAISQQQANPSFSGFFDTPATGPYELVEQPADALGGIQTVAQLRTWASTCKSRVVCPIHKIVVVHGTHVLLIGAPGRPGGLTAFWLRGDRAGSVLTWIQGPTDYAHGDLSHHRFEPQAALAVAGSIIARGG